MSTLILRPTADGNYTNWDGYSLGVPHTPLYDLIDEADYVVGAGDDDYISTSTAGAFSVLLSDCLAGAWPRATRICSIRVVAVLRQTGAGADFKFRLRVLDQDIDSPVQTITSTTYTEVGYTANLGLNRYAWDVPTVNRLEAGLVFDSGDELRCTKLEVYVHHEPFPHYTKVPEADGALQDWSPVPNTSPAYMTVGGVYDGDLSYLADQTVNNQSTFIPGDLPTSLNPPNIDRVDVKALVKNVGSVVEEADTLLRSGGTNYHGGTNTTSVKIYPDDEWYLLNESYLNDPNVAWPSGHPAATAWTAAEVNALEIGVENSGGGNFRCTANAMEVWLTPTYPTTIDLFPTADGYHQNWGSIVGAATAWQATDEDPPDNATSYVTLDADTLGISAYSSFDVGGAGAVPAGERIYSVELRYRVRLDNLPHSSALVAPVVRDTSGPETYVGKPQLIEGMASTWFDVKWDLQQNPHTGLPWTNLAEVTTNMEYGFVVLEGAMLLSRVRAQVQTITDYRAATVDPIDAKITDVADAIIVRSKADGTIFGVTEFSVGTGGYDTTDPETVTVADSSDISLINELYRGSVGRIEYDGEAVSPTVDYWCRVPKEVAQGGIGEFALWAEIFWSPVPGETGTKFMFALAHHPVQSRHVDDVHFYKATLKYWDFGGNLLVDGDAEFKGLQLLADGDMEAAGVGSWAAAAATLTKQGSAYQGSQCLRVAQTGAGAATASQAVLVIGQTYRVVGVTRSDGTSTPTVRNPSGNTLWTGTTSTSWQPFDFSFVASVSTSIFLTAQGGAATNYTEWDAVVVTNDVPAWTPSNSALLSKEVTSPYEGDQVLRVTYNGVATPGAQQTILTVGDLYWFNGRGRGDGTYVPRVTVLGAPEWTGTSSTAWQEFDFLYVADGTNFVLNTDASGAGYVEFDECSVRQVLSYDFLTHGSELLTDGDQEAVGVAAWTAGNAATLTKQTTNPYEGSQVLRVAYSAVNNPYASQSVMAPGTIYRVQGVMRSDGTGIPTVLDGATTLWTGVSTSTDWQAFDVAFEAANADIRFQCTIAGAGYCEVDAVSVKAITLP